MTREIIKLLQIIKHIDRSCYIFLYRSFILSKHIGFMTVGDFLRQIKGACLYCKHRLTPLQIKSLTAFYYIFDGRSIYYKEIECSRQQILHYKEAYQKTLFVIEARESFDKPLFDYTCI